MYEVKEYERIEYIKEMPIKCFIAEMECITYHWHPEVEIIFLIQGLLSVVDDGTKYDMREGDIILLNSKGIHSIYSDTDNLAIVLQFHPRIFQEYYHDTTFYFNLNSVAEKNLQPKDLKKLQSILASLGREIFQKADGYQFYINSYVFQLLGYLFRFTRYETMNKARKDVKDKDIERMDKIIKYIELNYKNEISLSVISEELYLSISQLNRFFKDKMGISCMEYVHDVRIHHAKLLLNEQQHTVMPISEECGFSSIASFYRVFKEKTGMTPTEYRTEGIHKDSKTDFTIQGYKTFNPLSGFEILLKYEL